MIIRFPLLLVLISFLVTVVSAQVPDEKPESKPERSQAEIYEEQVNSAPRLLEEARKELDAQPETIDSKSKADLPIATVEEEKTKVEAELAAARAESENLTARNAERTKRMSQLPKEIAEMKAKLMEIPETSEVDQQLRANLKTQLTLLEWEQQSYNATSSLLAARQELSERNLTVLEKNQRVWQTLFDTKHAEQTEKARKNAEATAQRFSDIPVLAKLADGNAEFAKERQIVGKQAAETETLLSAKLQLLKEIQEQRSAAKERITLLESANLEIDTETGKLLRLQRSNLPEASALTLELQNTIKATASAQIKLLEIRKISSSMPVDLDVEAARLSKGTGSPVVDPAAIRQLLSQKQSILRDLAKDYQLSIDALKKVSSALREIGVEKKIYRVYLDERLLWIPSAPPLASSDLAVEIDAIHRLFSAERSGKWLANFNSSLIQQPISWVLFAALLAYLLSRRKLFHRILAKSAAAAQKRTTTEILPTFRALAITLLLALPLALIPGFPGWRISQPGEISYALTICATFLFIFGSFLRMTSKNGFLKYHVKMEERRVNHLHWHLRWYFYLTPFVLFFFLALPGTGTAPQAGRLFFILLLLLQLVFIHCLFRPSKYLVPGSRLFARSIWLVAILIPILFIIGLCIGYISSVNTLRQQTMSSVGLILIGLLFVKISERWILLSRRRLALEIAHKKYRAQMEELRGKSDEDRESVPSLEEVEASAADVVTVETQTRKLLRIGMSVLVVSGILSIWASSLPALSFLDKIELWGGEDVETVAKSNTSSTVDSITSTLKDPSGAEEDTTETGSARSEATSLQDVLMAVIVVILFLGAARNLPGLLELSLLRRLHLKPGGNYAITTVLKYLLVAIGFLIAFGFIGMTWSSVQWLAAAITLGIGFGLQEIFANFVAGIILLFERPIRLGDVVTVTGDVSGRVTKIEIRATTIMQFNQRELIVPNKEFITGSLINWTLSNTTQRFDLPVGIAYGSDTEQATRILQGLLRNHPKILKDPEPQIVFNAFGASTLDFIIRAYVAHLDDFVSTQSELHYQIDAAFRKANIDIAIPQRDIFIRSLPDSFTGHGPPPVAMPTETK